MARSDIPRRPPSITQWRIDGEIRGGPTVAETLAYAEWCDAYTAEQAELRAQPGVISPQAEPRLFTWARRWFGR